MPTPAQSAASRANSLHSTGPITDEGKQAASQNAVAFGLFTQNDYVRPGEQDEYATFRDRHLDDLNPVGALEETLAIVIISAAWRMRRCALVEAGLAPASDRDPMQDDSASGLQNSVDRARSRAWNLLHRAMADLRRVQTNTRVRSELADDPDAVVPDLTDYAAMMRTFGDNATQILRAKKIHGLDSMKKMMDYMTPPKPAPTPTPAPAPPSASFCNEPPSVPRNARCPCGSREKYKRCCGKNAPAVLGKAA